MVRPCRPLVLQLAALVLLLSAANESTHASVSLVIENARVFTGNGFEDRTLYVEDGRFTDRRPANAPDVLDLGGKFVIPPFGDAHTHRFAGSGDAASARTLSLERGFLYVANLCNPKNARAATASVTNRADGVDVIFANGAITAPEGHPVALYRSIHERRGGTDTTFVTTWRDNTFYLVDTEEELGTVWVPEHGRWYWEGRRHLPNQGWTTDEFRRIAVAQRALEADLARRARSVVISDTDALVTSVWHERYLGTTDPHLDALIEPPDLYLVCCPDFEWVQDGTRESAAERTWMHERTVARVAASGAPSVLLAGSHAERLATALEHIRPLTIFPPLV